MSKPLRKSIVCLVNILTNMTGGFIVSGFALMLLQYILCHGAAPENMTWFGVFAAGGLITLMYISAGLILASVSTSLLVESWRANLLKSLFTGVCGGLIFVMSFVLMPINHEKLKVFLGAVAVFAASLFYLDYLLKKRRQKTETADRILR